MSTSDPHPVHKGLLDTEQADRDRVVLGASGADGGNGPQGAGGDGRRGEPWADGPTVTKLFGGILTLMSLIALTYLVPQLHFARPWAPGEDYVPFWNIIGRELMGQGAVAEQQSDEVQALAEAVAAAEEPTVVEPREVVERPTDDAAPVFPPYVAKPSDPDQSELNDAARFEFEESMEPFYRALTETDLGYGGSITRVGHWGDSVLGNDGITFAIRLSMQARFGDAGHGFHLLSRYDQSYRHRGVTFEDNGAWGQCPMMRRCKNDGRYGYGGVTTFSVAGGESTIGTGKGKVPISGSVSRFELWYLAAPNGGDFRVRIDGEKDVIVKTAADAPEDRREIIELADGRHRFNIRAVGNGRARGYGVVLERDGPGVTWDGMALIGAFTNRLLEADAEHWQGQLAQRDLDLAVFMLGGNDVSSKIPIDEYQRTYTELLTRTKAAKDNLSCLVVSLVDHGERKGGAIITSPRVPQLVEAQRQAAKAAGCAFFDIHAAMGGEGSMGRWRSTTPKLASGDLHHPSAEGHKVLGEFIFNAVMAGYIDYRAQVEGQPMPTPGGESP